MKKALLLTLLFAMVVTLGFSQSDRFWSANTVSRSSIVTDKAVARLSFPKEFKLFNLNIESLRQELFSIVGSQARKQITVISLPNAAGGFEEFEVNEASNFEPGLQARFPEIRAYSGRGITDRYATLKLSISPQGIQTMVFRAGKANEFIEPYSKDHSVYAVFNSQRDKGQLQWTCSTPEEKMANSLNAKVASSGFTESNTGELKTMRLAQSCNAEYSNYFGAFNAGQIGLVYAAFNATLTRCNGCYEKDLALHLNLIANSFEDQIIFFDPATDPYTTLGSWNGQLQNLLNTVVGDANYDIGHMFGASGGGGNAGCIGCVCVAGQKGSGITSPADNIPMGDNFDIDYVAHEVGHQLGGNHTFTHSTENNPAAQKEVGAGITIMGYAGITSYDPAPHSIDIFHETSIQQIQTNLATKSCPVTVVMTANHAPVLAALSNYTIPMQTPFVLTGSATDQENDPLTYCWEQDDYHGGQTGANSPARANKPVGPNFLTFPATTSGTRLFPKLSTVQAGLQITPVLPGGDAVCNIEALSNVSRTLNFKLTVRDNHPYVAGSTIGQTQVGSSVITVDGASGPFQVTIPNTNVSWAGGSSQTVTWSVNGTAGAPVSCANVKISLSTDGGATFPTVLLASTANDGTETVIIPNTASTTARIKVEAVGNIFYDMSDVNFTITGGTATNPTVTINQAAAQPDPTTVSPINFTVVFDQVVTGFATGDVTLSGTAGATTGTVTGSGTTYNVAVSGMTTTGTVIATIPAGVCQNAISEPNLPSTSTDNTVTFTIVATPPNVTINQAASQPDPTSVTPINFTVVFDQPVIGFATGDVTLSGTAGAATATVTGSGATYNVAVTGMTVSGTVIATIAAGVCTNTSLQPNNASTSTDNTVTFSTTCVPPTVNPVPNQTVCAGSPTAPVNFSGTPGASFSWTNNTPSIGLAASGSGNIASFIPVNNTALPITATIIVTPSVVGGGGTVPVSFTNPANITIPGTGTGSSAGSAASPYPSNITVSGVPATGVSVESITLTNIQHTWSDDIGVLLVGPGGQTFVPMARVGGSGGFDVVATVTIKDGSPAMPTVTAAIPSGTYGPTAGATAIWPAPAPAAPYNYPAPAGSSTFANTFNTTSDYNGTWSLYVTDMAAGDVGSIAGGWGITLLAPSSVCVGAPTSFTITVSPNPEIVIVADPGTTLCEGDPTLLTVKLGTATPPGNLYAQTSGVTLDGPPSQFFEPVNVAFNCQAADDFTVPSGTSWTVTRVTASGTNTGSGVATSVNVFFYNNSGANLPGTVVASYTNVATFTQAGGVYTVNLPAPLALSGGTYWVSVQPNMAFATSGQWFWGTYGAANIGNEHAWQNPGGGFGTPCSGWGYGATGCGVGGGVSRNLIFTVYGTSITGGGSLPPGYTFLWTPAAGLSSTTTNPVAASPMVTTNYTVTINNGTGCTRQTSILITVNQRPKVLTNPVSRTNCVGTSATFTVVGSGTGLTYQWQVSPTGCAGTWTNLANGAPYSNVTTAVLTVNPVTALMSGYAYRCILSGACAPGIPPLNVSSCAVLTVNPLPVVAITPPVSCGGVAGISGTQLSVGSAPPPVPGSVTINSGAISVPVPDNTANGVTSILNVAGVPATATITGISVKLNMPGHTYVGDMIFNLKAPNGTVLNLDKYMSGTATQAGAYPNSGFVNATISSAGTATLGSATTTPITGTWAADLINGTIPFTIQDITGFPSTATNWSALYSTPNGAWTLAMADGGPGDVGTLTNWSITIDYTTPGSGGGPTLSYVWSPLAGLYNNATATNPYLGTNTPTVYAAPTVFTAYTVTATDVATGCTSSATAFVNYTPPAPTVTPSSVTMCLGDPAVRLVSSSSSTSTVSASSGTISVAIPDGTGVAAISTLNIAGVPAASIIGEVKVTMNINHTWVGDVDVNIKAPNNAILNLVGSLDGGTGSNSTDNFTNTAFSSLGGATISGAAAPRTGTYAAEARAGYGPTGYIQTVNNWGALTPTPASANGAWTLAMGDFAGGDAGTLTSWSISISYITGVPSTPATWSPIAGLYNNSAATIAYTGDARDTVWTRPTPSGVYNYQATVQSLPAPPLGFSNPALITINDGTATPYPSNVVVSGLPTAGARVKSVTITGLNHTWSDDVDILLQSPSGQNVILMSDIGNAGVFNGNTYTFDDAAAAMPATAAAPPSGTYKPTNFVGLIGPEPDNWPSPGPGVVNQPNPTLSTFTGNMNGTWKLFVFDDAGGDQGTITGGYSVNFDLGILPCTSPARTVVVTVNQPTSVAAQPVNKTVCTDKVATFSAVAGGSGPFSYQWQVSTNTGNTYSNIANGGVYSGATSATLTITAPPVSMSGYFYRVVITGAAPCAAVNSFAAVLTVNPLPTIVISASPYTSLFPGLRTTLSSTVTPNAAGPGGYSWLRNGAVVSGANTGTLNVDVDGLGDYSLRVTDVNGCTNTSNTISIKDSVSARCFIYPNPTSGKFQVRYYSVANNVLPRTLTVFDAKGDRVFTQFYTVGRPYDRMDVDMRAYGKGLYWVEIGDLNGNRLTMCRVVIQ